MATATTYRLTSPRKFLRALMILALAATMSVVGISNSVATSAEPAPLVYVTVSAGDSLWSLAEQYAQGDPRDWIAEVVIVNGLQSSTLTPGQQIALP